MNSKTLLFFSGFFSAAFECNQVGDQVSQLIATEHPRKAGRHRRALFIKVFDRIAVDDNPKARASLLEMGVVMLDGRFLDFLDPWGNRVELTTYVNIQFTKADHVLRGMGLGHLEKTDNALTELREKGMAPD